MKISCPECTYSGSIDFPETDAQRVTLTCPKCKSRFKVGKSCTDSTLVKPPEKTLICPKCGKVQDKTQSCVACGVIFNKYRPDEVKRIQADDKSVKPREGKFKFTEACYASLLIRRIPTILFGILMLLLGIGALRGINLKNARMERIKAHNDEQRRKAELGTPRPVWSAKINTPENKRLVRSELGIIEEKTRELAQLCITECNRNVSRINGEPDPGKDASGAQSPLNQDNNLNDAIQEVRKKLQTLGSVPSEYSQYRNSIFLLVDSTDKLNRLRINPTAENYRDELETRSRGFSSNLRVVEFYRPKD